MSTTSNSLWQARAKLMKRLVPVVREIFFTNRFDSPSKKQRIEALELTELVVFHVGLSLRELSNFKTPNGRIALKNLVELLRQIRSEFFSACSEGLHYMDYNYTGAPVRLRESIKRKCAQIYNNADLENSHPFYKEKIQSLTWSWPRIIEISGLESRGRFEAYFENAKNVYMNWFRTFCKEGRDAALLQLREELWTDSEKATEAQLVATKVQVFDDLASRIEPPAAALPASFPKFSDFPVELQLKIWGHTFESRTVEIQFYVSEPPKWDEVMRWRNGKGNLYFQKVARSGFRTDVPMIEVWKTWDAEFSAQQRMHYDARPRQYVRAPPPPPPPPPMEDWEERYVDSLHSGGAEIGGFPLESLDNDDAEGWVDDAGPAEYSGFVQPGYGPPGFFPPGSGPPGSGPPGFGPSGFPPGFGPESDPADVLAAGYTMPGFQTEPEEDPSDRTGLFKSPAPPPVALFVTKQSRAEALRFYKKRFITPGHQDSGIYVDFDHDEILLDIETFGRCIFKNAPKDADELVRWLGWHGGLSKIDMESRSGIKNLSMSVRLLDPRWFYDRRKIMRRFPSLQRLSLIHKTTSVFDYRLVTDYRIHQIYNKKFPKHKNQFFEEPFIRYLDKSLSWFPGSDHPSNTQGMRRTNDGTQAYGHINEDPYPGVYPIGEDFISKLQRCKVSFEDIGNQKYPYQRREVVGFGPDSDGDDDFNFNDYNFDDDDSDGDDFYGNIVDDDNSDEGDESDGDDSHGDDSHGDDSHGDDSHGDDSHGYNSNGGVGHGNNHQRDEIPNGLQVRSVRLWRGKPKGPIKVFSRQNRPQRPSRSGASSMSGTSQDSPGNKSDEEDEDGWSDSVEDDDNARWQYYDDEDYWFRRNKVWSKYKQPKEITIEKSVYEHDLIAFEALLRATAW